jgi:hypothetical protein
MLITKDGKEIKINQVKGDVYEILEHQTMLQSMVFYMGIGLMELTQQ